MLEPVRETLLQAEASGLQPLVVGGTHSSVLPEVCRVHMGTERCDERVEHVRRDCDEGRHPGIRDWEQYLEAKNCRGIRPFEMVRVWLAVGFVLDGIRPKPTITDEYHACPHAGIIWREAHKDTFGTRLFETGKLYKEVLLPQRR